MSVKTGDRGGTHECAENLFIKFFVKIKVESIIIAIVANNSSIDMLVLRDM